MKIPFVWIGSGRAKKRGVGSKGRLLDRAARAGLPVPGGAILLHDFYQLALKEEIVLVENGSVLVPDPDFLYETLYKGIHLPRLDKPLAIRAAFSAVAGDGQSQTTPSISKLYVDGNDPVQLANSLREVWSSALQRSHDRPHSENGLHLRRDVLIMEMVDAQVAGTAFTEQAYEDDLVNFTWQTAAPPDPATTANQPLTLPKRHAWEPTSSNLPPFARRLQMLLRGVRRTLGCEDWHIEWADDGNICWLLQIQPLTSPTPRNDIFARLPVKEVAASLPSPLMSSIIASCAPDLLAHYRRFDKRLSAKRPLIETFAARPCFNLSLLTGTLRAWGLPTRLLSPFPGSPAANETDFNVLRFFRNFIPLLRVGWVQATAVSSSNRAARLMLARTRQPGKTFGQCVDTLHWLSTTALAQLFNLTAALRVSRLILGRGWLARLGQWQYGRLTRAREQFHHSATAGYESVRTRLLALAETAVAAGQLPQRDLLWLLHPDEVRALDKGKGFDTPFFHQRKQEFETLKQYKLPDLIHHFQDLEQYRENHNAGYQSAPDE